MDRHALVEAILDLEHDRAAQIEDPGLAEELGAHVKELVDELAGLRVAAGQPEVTEAGPDERGARRRKVRGRGKDAGKPAGPVPRILSLPPGEQARWMFMERNISLEKHEEILGLRLQPEMFADYQESFDRLIRDLLLLPRALEAAEKNDVPGLQRLFASCVPVFRCPELAQDDAGDPLPCTLENLRQRYPSYFYRRRKRPNWFEAQGFYTEPVPGPRWVLVDTEFVNCTLRRPERKLTNYARDWDLPAEYAHQKSVAEDVYDRIVIGEALGEDLLAGNSSNLTSTRYRAARKGAERLVFTVQKVHKITIHGKAGVPHWRATRRLWPGVHPTLAFPDV